MQELLTITLLVTSLLGTATALNYKSDLNLRDAQKHINDKNTIRLVRQISELARDIRVATYPTACDDETIKIIGETCDVGNYMEWAGPQLEREAEALLVQLTDKGSLSTDEMD